MVLRNGYVCSKGLILSIFFFFFEQPRVAIESDFRDYMGNGIVPKAIN